MAAEAFSSAMLPKDIVPRQSLETLTPVRPNMPYSIEQLSPFYGQQETALDFIQVPPDWQNLPFSTNCPKDTV